MMSGLGTTSRRGLSCLVSVGRVRGELPHADQMLDRRGMLQAGGATVGLAAVGMVAGASPAAAQTAALRVGTVVFAVGEHSKDVPLTGLTSSSCAFAMQQAPRGANVPATPPVIAHVDRNAGVVSIVIDESSYGGNRFWNVTVAWLVIG